jgi:polyribonucleotide nucleotidyltransferase
MSRLCAAPAHDEDPPGQDPRRDRQGWRDHPGDHRGNRREIDIQDDGTIVIASVNAGAAQAAKARIESITSDVEPGRIYEGKVAKLMDFGAFVTILPGRDGLVHVSQISNERVEKVSDKLKEGDIVRVKVLEVDKQGRIRLSIKAVLEDEAAAG